MINFNNIIKKEYVLQKLYPVSGMRDVKSRVYKELLFVPNPLTRTAATRDFEQHVPTPSRSGRNIPTYVSIQSRRKGS